jgi:hypothetical protein
MRYKFYLGYINTSPLTDSGAGQGDGLSKFDRQVWSEIVGDDCDASLRTGAFFPIDDNFKKFKEIFLAETQRMSRV